MASASFVVDGVVLRALLGLPAEAQVDSVVVEVSHRRIKPGHDIDPTFHMVGGRQRLKSWNQKPLPKSRPLSPVERDLLKQQVDGLSKSLAFARNVNRNYEREFAASDAKVPVTLHLPKRYRR